MEARLILGLCERFGCIPDVAYEMDAGVLRLLAIERTYRDEGGEEG